MPKAFSVASWNVEHFKNAPSRVGAVIALLASLDPDVFALYEVEGKDVFGELVTQMPGYQFHITESPLLGPSGERIFVRTVWLSTPCPAAFTSLP